MHNHHLKAVFIIEILAFIAIAFMAVAVEGPTGGVFVRNTHFGLSGDVWLFVVAIPLLLLIPLVMDGFHSKIVGTLLSGAFIGVVLEDFTWFLINPNYGLQNFNPSKATWLAWANFGSFSVPIGYIIGVALALLSWFVFIRNASRIDATYKRIRGAIAKP